MTTDFQKDSLVFAQKCFDDVRAMSKDTTGVSRQGYSPVETKVLEYFKKIGVEPRTGYKFGQWLDLAYWWMDLRPGQEPPEPVRLGR